MTTGLDQQDLERKFSNIELFLGTFPEDPAIREASIDLISATLKAIEDVIGFFLESNGELKPSDVSYLGILFPIQFAKLYCKIIQPKRLFLRLFEERTIKRKLSKVLNRLGSVVTSFLELPRSHTFQKLSANWTLF